MGEFTITVVGAGVIGVSLGLALKKQKESFRLLAHDKELDNARTAVKLGAFDKAEWNLVNACEQADLIILAIPLNGIRPTLEAIGPYLKRGVVVSDTCRKKLAPVTWAKDLLPEHAHFIGGDPVVHPTGLGRDHATADLFRHKLYCLTPAPSAHEEAIQLMVNFITLLGAEPFFLDAAEHDGLVTAAENLPRLLSMALLATLSEQNSWREIRKLAGGLFEQVSAGATGDPDAIRDDFVQNQPALLSWLDRYMAQLAKMRELLLNPAESAEPLAQKIDEAVVTRLNWLDEYKQGSFIDKELASTKIENPGLLSQMVGFGALRKRTTDPAKGSGKKPKE
jgi:prephenate dehydrogenase